MTDLQAIADCKEHWKRMIAQVEVFIENETPYISTDNAVEIMFEAIKEVWGSLHCALCRMRAPLYTCGECPLKKINNCCFDDISTFKKVNKSTSWPEWKRNTETYMLPALDRAEQFCRDRGDTE